jgi:hypothetical protein
MAPRGLFGFGNTVQSPPAAHDALDMVRRAVPSDREQPLFGFRCRDSRQRPDLRVRELTAGERLGDPRQHRQRSGDADVFPCGTDGEAAPRQPVST